MKALLPIVIIALAALIYFATRSNEPSGPEISSADSTSSSASTSPDHDEANEQQPSSKPTPSDRQREVTIVPNRGTWHPTEKLHLVSPYTNEMLPAVGVVGGSKMKDSAGNTFIVPPFEDSPFPIKPVSAAIPDRPGYVFNPFTNGAVDVRGVPPGSLVRDPADSDPTHIFRTPE